MITFKKLKEMEEFELFSKNYASAFEGKSTEGIYVAPEKLAKKSLVMGVFKDGEMLAGFIVNDRPDYCFEIITNENKKDMAGVAPLDSYYDLGGIWKNKKLSRSTFNSIVWPRIIFETLKFNPKKKRIVGYVAGGHGRARSYDMADPIYHQRSKTEMSIFSMTRTGLVKALFKSVGNDLLKTPKEQIAKPIRNIKRVVKHINLVR